MDAHNASLQRLQALYKQLDLVDMVRRLLSDSTLQSSNVSATISLHDNLIRLRNWEREICVNTLPNFEVSNQNIVHILCGHVREIGNDLVAIKAALSNGDISGIDNPLRRLDTEIDELVESSEPVIAAIEIARKVGPLGMLMHNIEGLCEPASHKLSSNMSSSTVSASFHISSKDKAPYLDSQQPLVRKLLEDRSGAEHQIEQESGDGEKGLMAHQHDVRQALISEATKSQLDRNDIQDYAGRSRDISRQDLAAEIVSKRPAETKSEAPLSKGAVTISRSKSNAEKKKEHQQAANVSKRFMHLEDAGHEHQLRVQRREEKLKDMFQNLMLGKKKEANPEEQPLSLMSGWVDQLRNDKEKFNIDHKAGASSSMTLVQKYGKCQEIIGRGAFGIVKIAHKPDAKDPKREQLFAVKEFKQRPGESDKKYNKRLTSEFCISSSMHHPNIINTLDLIQDEKGEFCEVMEYCAGGDLYTLILAAGQLEVVEADCFFKQLMRGADYLHGMGVAHRDLKPENLLLTSHGAIKITDFGNGECFRMAWEEEAHMTAGICGSAPYIAPEEYVDEEFDPRAVDVWACGVIYMAMRTGRHLWRIAKKGEDEFYTKYLEDRKEESGYRPIEVLRRRQCRNVIYSILDPNPNRRLTAEEVNRSEWVDQIRLCRAGDEGF